MHRVIITLGDPAGVGWQILKKILHSPSKYFNSKVQKKISSLIVVGDIIKEEEKTMHELFHVIHPNQDISLIDFREILKKNKDQNTSSSNNKPIFLAFRRIEAHFGRPTLDTARRSYRYITEAISLWHAIPDSSLVTLPVSKEQIIRSGSKFVGHTEELGQSYAKDTFMCMYHPTLSVIPLTGHIPLKKVPSGVKKLNFKALANAIDFFLSFFQPIRPIAMLALNPHAGEGGKIGKEEFFLKKKLNELKKSRIRIEGLFPADGFFNPLIRKRFSLAIACYHDQGLIAFKALFGLEGINITLNLPKLRVSPDHGPAFSLANSNNVDIRSVQNSLLFCFKWGKRWIKHFSCQP